MNSKINIFDSNFISFSSEKNGGAILIEKSSSSVYLRKILFSKCECVKYGGSCYLYTSYFHIKCCFFCESKSSEGQAAFFENNSQESYFLLSSVANSAVNQENSTNGAPTLFKFSSFISSNVNNSNNIVNHICGMNSVNCKKSYVKYNNFINSESREQGVLCQAQTNGEIVVYKFNNFIGNNVNKDFYGLIRTYESNISLIMCYFKENTAKIIFHNDSGNIEVVNCFIDQDLTTETISSIITTQINENEIETPHFQLFQL